MQGKAERWKEYIHKLFDDKVREVKFEKIVRPKITFGEIKYAIKNM